MGRSREGSNRSASRGRVPGLTRMKLLGRYVPVKPGVYRHHKGQYYQVLGVARHSETLEEYVMYKALYKNKLGALWVRPKTMFLEEVVVNGKKLPRFAYTGRKRPLEKK